MLSIHNLQCLGTTELNGCTRSLQYHELANTSGVPHHAEATPGGPEHDGEEQHSARKIQRSNHPHVNKVLLKCVLTPFCALRVDLGADLCGRLQGQRAHHDGDVALPLAATVQYRHELGRHGKIWHHTFYNDDFGTAADSFVAKNAFLATQRRQVEERIRSITHSTTTRTKVRRVRPPAVCEWRIRGRAVPQGAAGRGPPAATGWQGKKSEKTVQGDQPVHRAALYRKIIQWAEQAAVNDGRCCMRIASVNTRGWHWALTDAVHQVKTGKFLWLMRREKLDILLLSDVHTSDAGRFQNE